MKKIAMIFSLLILIMLLLIQVACTPLTTPPQEVPPTPVNTSIPSPGPTHTLPPEETTVSPATPITGEAPQDVLEKVLADLQQRLGHKPSQVEVLRSEFVTWSDGSLGCPKPGVYYTQATIDGYWIVLKADGKTYDYRVGSSHSTPVLCSES